MPITVIVRSATGDEARLTFDGTQRVVIGRGASCDVRLPDASVSHRHAVLRAQRAEFVLVDEGSTNGTYVGGVRIAPHTSRIVRSGDRVRIGRVWLELSVDQSPVTRDVAAATRDLALAWVAHVMKAMGQDRSTRVRVVEGPDQGAELALAEEERPYVVGRSAACALPLADADASREHAQVVQRAGVVLVRDLGAKNGTWLGGARVPALGEAIWRPAQMVQIGRTVLALEEPVGDALARIESAPDQPVAPEDAPPPPPPPPAPVPGADAPATSAPGVPPPAGAASIAAVPPAGAEAGRRATAPRTRWSAADLVVMAAALSVLALSIAGLVWLLRS